MSFAQDNGYTPRDLESILDDFRVRINSIFSLNYTPETFIGTNWYKYLYGPAQRVQEGEIKTAEVFQKLQEYIAETNDRIQRPSVSFPGIVDSFESRGFVASVKPPEEIDAGKIFICVDVDDTDPDYDEVKEEIASLIKDFVAGGLVSQGTESVDITLSNGQSFPFKFSLPTEIPVLLRLTLTVSDNNLFTIPSDEEIRQAVFDNINERYRLGWDFEPQRYFTLSDALWAGQVVLEYSTNGGGSWASSIYDGAYTDLFTFGLEDIEVVVIP